MAEQGWLEILAGHPADLPLLSAATGEWTAGAMITEIQALQQRLHGSRVVAVLADNSPAWLLADLACQSAGLVHLPLPGFFNAAQLQHALTQSAADTVLTDQPERIGALDLGFAITGRWQGLTWLRRVVEPQALPPGTAKISFTSGSTGAPKGVCLSAGGLLDTARAVQTRLADLPLQRHLAVLPLALLLENVAGCYTALLRGIPLSLPALADLGWRGMAGFDPGTLAQAVDGSRASSVILVPELLKAWTLFLQQSCGRPQNSLQFVAVGGARVAPALLQAARQAGIPAYQGYGLTEGGSVLALNRPGDDGDDVGRPLAHARLRVDDGELIVDSRTFLGYAGNPASHAGGFPTGDLASIDGNGHLHLSGRRKNLLITSFGRNISPEWVEARLLAEAQILQGIVVGDGQPALTAIVVAAPGCSNDDLAAAIARCNADLPDYARIADFITSPPFTAANGLATGNGRPQRAAILDQHASTLANRHASQELQDVVL